MIGKMISHYQILEKLGEGGMGVVYKAQDVKLNRAVALKFLPQHLSASEQDKARFIQEAQAAAALNHPNICTIYGIEEIDNPEGARQMFIAMEFVEGQTLRDKTRAVGAIHESPLQMKQAIEIGIQLADGLAAAHEKGIVHRDIKPENIMLQKDGRVRIMDFGLAKLKSASRLTKVGSTVGTTGYMSPEQVQGQESDHRSDIFSLGVILYEMFAGQSPFKGVHETAINYEIVNVDPQPISSVKPEVDPSLDAIVLECMEKDVNERSQSAKQVSIDLKRFKRESSRTRLSRTMPARQFDPTSSRTIGESAPEKKSFKQYLWPGLTGLVAAAGIFVVALLLGVGAGWVFLSPSKPFPSGVTRFILPLKGEASSSEDGFTQFLLSPDGLHLAYIAGRGQNEQLYIRDMDKFEAQALPNTKGLNITELFFSLDSRWIGFFSRGKMMKLSLSGGTPITICDAGPQGSASWGEGGTIVFMQEWGSHLWMVSSEAGSTPRPLTQLKHEEGERAHLLPSMLPGGKAALFTIWTGASFEEAHIAVVDLSTGEHRVVVRGGSDARFVKTGHIVYARGATIMAVPFDLSNLKVAGEPAPTIDNVRLDGAGGYSSFSISENGTFVYVAGRIEYVPTMMTLFDGPAKSKQIPSKEKSFGNPLFSPDGKKLAVIIYGSTYHLGLYDLQRDILTPLTFSGDNDRLAWLRDGSRLSFMSNLDGKYQIYMIAADGSGTPEKLFEQEGNPYPGSWSHDGKMLAYVVTGKETKSDIWIFSKDGKPEIRPLVATRASETGPQISPDGRWIAYISDESGENEVYVQPFPSGSGKWRISSGGGSLPRWAPDGKRIYFTRREEIFSVPLTISVGQAGGTIAVGREERVMATQGLNSFDVSPNGKTIIVAQRGVGTLPDKFHVVLNWFEELKKQGEKQ